MSRPGAGTPQGSGEFPGGKGWNGARIDWLRARLGSVTRPLSYADLGGLVQARLKRKPPHASSKFHRWASGEGEPDAETQAVFAELAEMSFERWCLGKERTAPTMPLESFQPMESAALKRAPRKGRQA